MLNSHSTSETGTAGNAASAKSNTIRRHRVYRIAIFGDEAENTRFDPDNCDALCFRCHQFLGGDGREEYIAFKKKQLGEKGYKDLKIRAFTYRKKDDKLALLFINQLVKDAERSL